MRNKYDLRALSRLRQHPELTAVMAARSFAKMNVVEQSHNRGRWVDAIIEMGGGDDDDAPAWCAYFAWGCWHMGCLTLGLELDSRTSGGVIRSWHKNPDAQYNIRDAKMGDLMIRVRDEDDVEKVLEGGTVPGHTELIVDISADGWVHTIGGNTISEDSAEGNGVFEKKRGIHVDDPRIIGALRPKTKRLF
jgi:hypothetical protein